MNPVSLAKQHPAEAAMPLATALAALICSLLGVEDTDTILYLAIVLSFVPALVTWVVGRARRPQGGDDGAEAELAQEALKATDGGLPRGPPAAPSTPSASEIRLSRWRPREPRSAATRTPVPIAR